ncbi:unnamed protein product [Rhodiola kirilowii]
MTRRSKKRKRGKTELGAYAKKLKCSYKEDSEISINSILQDDLLEQILVYLPIASIIIARSVCKKWLEITSSTRFLWNASQTGSQKPWFLKFISSENKPNRYVYDPVFQKWQGRDFLDMIESYMFCDSSDGLVCFIKDYAIHVCNPITREHKMLQEPPGLIRLIERGYPVLINISVNRGAHNYIVSILTCEKEELSVQIYDSTIMKWATSHTEVLTEWTTGIQSVICNMVLYFLIYSTADDSQEQCLLAYNFLNNSSSHGTLIKSLIPLPCSNIYGLMNLKEKLIMVGGIVGPPGERSIIGFSIWLLEGKDWQLISRITNHCFQRCGDSFDSSGADDLIYIHGNHLPLLLVFDMNLKQWKWCQKFPMKDVFGGFCFQPRLDISPYSRHELTSSKRFLWDVSQTVSQKPWFFKFICYSENEPNGYAYDPILQKWQRMDFPNMIDSYKFCDSSDGLVCYIKDHAIHVSNPITREHKMLQEPLFLVRSIEDGSPNRINISINQKAHNYSVSLLTCEEVRARGSLEKLSVQIYDSSTMKWATSHTEVLKGWTIGGKSVICNGVLYFLIDSTGDGPREHGLLAYNLSSNSLSDGTLIKSFIRLPCSLIFGLMNLKENLFMVGGIDYPWIHGFSIWLLEGKDWQLISRIITDSFQGCGDGDSFHSSGANDLIYINDNNDSRLLIFDMNLKQWKWCQKVPMKGVFNGFCFQPRVDISPRSKHEITSFQRFFRNASETVSQKPWFFRFISENEQYGYAYDPILQKWQRRDFLDMKESFMFCDSSNGLVCYVKDNAIHVCNPITSEHKNLHGPTGLTRLIEYGDNDLINISVNLRARKYNVSLLTCEDVTGSCGELSVQIYDSETMKWATSHKEVLTGWTTGCKSVICNRVLYFLIDSSGGGALEHGLLAYNFASNSSSHDSLLKSFIPLPCSRIYGLMNLKENLIIVGGIDNPTIPTSWGEESILGFSIWLLEGKEWQVISRITDYDFQQCGYIFDSCGADDLIYIHGNYDPGLVAFDMNLNQWEWCEKFPVEGVEEGMVNGFCFEPRTDISP